MIAASSILVLLILMAFASKSKASMAPRHVQDEILRVASNPESDEAELSRAASLASTHGYPKAASALAAKALHKRHGKKIGASPHESASYEGPTGAVKSPWSDVAQAAWVKFVRLMGHGDPGVVTGDYHLGLFGMGTRRLVDLKLMRNPRKALYKGRAGVWLGDWVAPGSEAKFLSSPDVQYRAFTTSMEGYRRQILAHHRAAIGTDLAGRKATMSGLLAVAHKAGAHGLASWLASPDVQLKFPRTTEAYTQATGIF